MRNLLLAGLMLAAAPLLAQAPVIPPIDPMANDKVPSNDWVRPQADYVRREVMLPMRDGTKLGIGIEIFRGRYVHGFATPAPLKPRQTYTFGWSLPNVNHLFLPGHRIMVQVQSSLFPLYDRNPQTWVPSIFDAPASAYQKARQTVRWGGAEASAVWLPLVGD